MNRKFSHIRPGGDWQFGPQEIVSETVWRDAKRLTLQLVNTYELLLPGEDHGIRPLSEGPGVDWASLEDALIGSMVDGLRGNESLHPCQYGELSTAAGRLSVTADHIVNNFWWLECFPSRAQGSDDSETGLVSRPAVAIMRISGSGAHLPYDSNSSLRIV